MVFRQREYVVFVMCDGVGGPTGVCVVSRMWMFAVMFNVLGVADVVFRLCVPPLFPLCFP